ncbi:MAG: protein kinase [Acidobacteriota bacterium]
MSLVDSRSSTPAVELEPPAFSGSDRFLIQRRLGAGAFGVVYEAYDRGHDALVALKVLRHAEADALYRFKKGFRSLADLRHPNLITFHELLHTSDGQWILVMELIDGEDVIESLRAGLDPGEPADFDRVRSVVLQLAQGLFALHRHGKLHRDIKPPNVLLERGTDRVVLLDFGLVAELKSFHAEETETHQMVGTPMYMAPELTDGQFLPASDWFSVGVLLYEAMLGELPFTGSLIELIEAKRAGIGERLEQRLPDTPRDLLRVCNGLLQPSAGARPSGEAVIELLASADGGELPRLPAPLVPAFVGRRSEISALEHALFDSRREAVSVFIHGGAGMGKTTLVHRFLRVLEEDGEPVTVLAGRCHRQESVPYKALDSLIDALSRELRWMTEDRLDELLPSHIHALVRLFPVLRRVPAVAAAAAGPSSPIRDPRTLRRRAIGALRDLLSRLANHRPLVLFVDDLHWGDVDSFGLFEELLRPPYPPALLLIGCYRSAERRTSPFLRALSEHRASLRGRGADVREIEAGPLSVDDARLLVVKLADGVETVEIDQIVDEAAGSPLFLTELTEWSVEHGEELTSARLRDVIKARLEPLPVAARRLLEVVAVAGKPVEVEVARQAAELAGQGGVSLLIDRLHSDRLLRRTIGNDGRDEVELMHDRIRAAVLDELDSRALRDCHRRLAVALESTGHADAETLAVHFQGTEDMERARGYITSAAARAEEAFAFARAARLYRLALELEPVASHAQRLRAQLGSALAHAGHSREAAEVYLDAAQRGVDESAHEMRRRAAEQLLISGHIDQGMEVLHDVLASTGMSLRWRPARTLLRLWWLRSRLAFRGFDFTPRRPMDCDPELLRRIDACWSAEIGLCLVDLLHAATFHARHLYLALESGEESRVARAFAMEIFFGTFEGGDADAATARAASLASQAQSTYAASLTELATGMRHCARGEWSEAHTRLETAEALFGDTNEATTWELDTTIHFLVLTGWNLGRWRELFERLPALLALARERGDRYLALYLECWAAVWRRLADDEPLDALEAVDEAIASWSQKGFHYQHFGHLLARTQIDLYRGEAAAAWRRLRDAWQPLTRSLIQRMPLVLVQSYDLRARAAVATATEAGPGESALVERALSSAERDARRLRGTDSPWAQALASVVEAGVASVEGRTERAREALDKAETAFGECEMTLHRMLVRRRRGQLLGGREGVQWVETADQWLRSQGVRQPQRIAAVLTPGVWS